MEKPINFLGNKWKNYIIHMRKGTVSAPMETVEYIERLQLQISELRELVEKWMPQIPDDDRR